MIINESFLNLVGRVAQGMLANPNMTNRTRSDHVINEAVRISTEIYRRCALGPVGVKMEQRPDIDFSKVLGDDGMESAPAAAEPTHRDVLECRREES